MNKFAYVRVSSKDQFEDRQILALGSYEIPECNIFIDKQSGKDFKRPEYKKMIRKMKKDDQLFIKSIDRLGRNYEEILNQWQFLIKEKKIDIIVLDMPLLDTTKSKDLFGTFISDLVLQILSFVAENERVNIKQRQKEGIKAAKLRGIRFGRPIKEIPDCAFEKYIQHSMSIHEISSTYNVAHSTFYRKFKEYKKQKLS